MPLDCVSKGIISLVFYHVVDRYSIARLGISHNQKQKRFTDLLNQGPPLRPTHPEWLDEPGRKIERLDIEDMNDGCGSVS